MPFCRSCGNRVPDDSVFCGTCGTPLALDSSTTSKTFQRDALSETNPEETVIVRKEVDASITRTEISSNPMPSTIQAEASRQGEEEQPEIVPLPPIGQSSLPTGHVPTIPGTPQVSHVPTLPGVPKASSVPALHGTPSPNQPGNSPQTPHVDNPAAQQGRAGQPGRAHANEAAQHHAPRQGRWRLQRAAQAAHHSAVNSGAGSAAGAIGTGAVVKAIVAIAIVVAAGAGAVKAVPQIFQHGSNAQAAITTQPMPPTLTTCPAAGTARAMVSARLVPGHHQALVFSTGTKLERYDSSTGSTTTLLQNNAVGDAQLSPDGVWIIVVDQVGGQSALQMVRLDGQGQQTLYCAPTGQVLSDLAWSPDQETVAFNQGTPSLFSDGSNNTYLLQPKAGKLSIGLIQPAADPNHPYQGRSAYLPLYWVDNTHLYMRGEPVCCGLGGVGPGAVPAFLYLLDTSHGFKQHEGDLKLITRLEFGFSEGIAFSPDRSKLLLCVYTFGANSNGGLSSSGPSPITEQSTAGGSASTIYTDPNNAIFDIATIDQSDLLIVIGNSDGTGQNGLWKLNMKSQQMTRLLADTATNGPDIQLNASTMSPWGNVARDGSMYAATQVIYDTTNQPTSASLLVGSLQGSGSAKTLISMNSITGSDGFPVISLSVVGWTTM